MRDNNLKALPPPNDKLPDKTGNDWTLEDEHETIQSLESLLEEVNKLINRGMEIQYVFQRKQLCPADSKSKPLIVDEEYPNQLIFYKTRTSKGYKPAIGIRHVCSDIWDAVYLITRSPEKFPGKALRVVSIVETCMIHIGLHGLDLMLAGRSRIVQQRKNAIWKGGKRKRQMPIPRQYKFASFTDSLENQQNVWCLSPNDYARLATIAEDFYWDMGFVVQMAMIVAIAYSDTLPEDLRKMAIEEVTYFEEYLKLY